MEEPTIAKRRLILVLLKPVLGAVGGLLAGFGGSRVYGIPEFWIGGLVVGLGTASGGARR